MAAGAASRRWVTVEAEGAVTTVTLARPAKANAYHQPMLDDLERALDAISADERCAAVIVASQGRAFCGGADLSEIAARSPSDALGLRSQRLFQRLASLSQVSIAAVQGPAIAGGFELVLSCDLCVASPLARFALPETGHGIIPAAGGTQLLPRLIGASRAKAVILAGKDISAEEALAWGLVMEIAPPEGLMEQARALAERIAERDVMATRLAKLAIDAPARGQGGLAMETVSQALLTAWKRSGT